MFPVMDGGQKLAAAACVSTHPGKRLSDPRHRCPFGVPARRGHRGPGAGESCYLNKAVGGFTEAPPSQTSAAGSQPHALLGSLDSLLPPHTGETSELSCG